MYLYLNCLNISTLSSYDRACLVAKYNSLYRRETIDPKMFKNRSEEDIKYLRKTMSGTVQQSCNLAFTKEFKEYPEYDHFNFAMMAGNIFNKAGALPFPGSLSEQPAQMVDILETLFELDTEREQDAQRKAQKDREKDKNGR